MTFPESEEPTRTELARLQLRSVPPDQGGPPDLYKLMGQVMAETVSTRGAVQGMRVELGTLSRELRELREEIKQDRGAIAEDAGTHAAKHTSNRMALLVSGLVVVYDQAAPFLHELWRQLHHG